MMQFDETTRSNLLLLGGALVALILIAILSVILQPPQPVPDLSVRSVDRNGAMAVSLWLQRSGYTVREVTSEPLRLDSSIDTLFILDPIFPYSDAEIGRIYDWVWDGGTLIVAGTPFYLNDLLAEFDVSLQYQFSGEADTLHAPTSPILQAPPVEPAELRPIFGIISDRSDTLLHFAVNDIAVVASFNEGSGTVWLSGALHPFTNEGLSNTGNARLILNMVAGTPETATIGFDETHHGFGERPGSLFAWLVGTAPGWGIIALLVLTVWFLSLNGRRFGRAVPIPQERLRRESTEYIQAMANLFRRSGHRDEMLRHYDHQLRRHLSERYSVDPRLDRHDLVKAVIYRNDNLDEAELRDLFERLSSKRVNEQQLFHIVSDLDNWLRKTD